MTDREMLLFAYGALKISAEDNTNMSLVVTMLEEHLYPPTIVNKEEDAG